MKWRIASSEFRKWHGLDGRWSQSGALSQGLLVHLAEEESSICGWVYISNNKVIRRNCACVYCNMLWSVLWCGLICIWCKFNLISFSRCRVKLTGDMVISFPAGIIGVLLENPSPAVLSCRIKKTSKLEQILINKQLVSECVDSLNHRVCILLILESMFQCSSNLFLVYKSLNLLCTVLLMYIVCFGCRQGDFALYVW